MSVSDWVEYERTFFAEQVANELEVDGDIVTYEVYGIFELEGPELAAQVEDVCETWWYAKPGTEPGTVVVDWNEVEQDKRGGI